MRTKDSRAVLRGLGRSNAPRLPGATGVFSSRKIERATDEAVPLRFIAGNLHPDHDTLATFRRTFLPELKELFVQVLLLAKAGGCAAAGHDQSGWDQDPC